MHKRLLPLLMLILTAFTQASFCVPLNSGWTIFSRLGSTRNETLDTCSPQTGEVSSINGFIYNPASLGINAYNGVVFFSENGTFEDRYGSFLFSKSVSEKSRLAFCAAYYDAGSEDLYWMDNGTLQQRSVSVQRDMLGIASFENRVHNKLSLGVSLKYASSRLAEMQSANAYACDIGMSWQRWKNGVLTLGIQNIGNATAFISETDPLPQAVFLGIGQLMNMGSYYLIAGISAKGYANGNSQVVPEAGLELGKNHISINLGLRSDDTTGTKEVQTQFGANVSFNRFSFGYSYINGSSLNPIQRFSIGYKLGNDKPKTLPSIVTPKQSAPIAAGANVKKKAVFKK
jgi:hypothetical protein